MGPIIRVKPNSSFNACELAEASITCDQDWQFNRLLTMYADVCDIEKITVVTGSAYGSCHENGNGGTPVPIVLKSANDELEWLAWKNGKFLAM